MSLLSPGTKGAISELHVCAHLLNLGYEVFRAVSQSCSCDLVIHKDGKLARVEVKSQPIAFKDVRADILDVATPKEIAFALVNENIEIDISALSPARDELAFQIRFPSVMKKKRKIRSNQMKPALVQTPKEYTYWRVFAPARFSPTGKMQQKYFDTLEEAQAFSDAFKRDINASLV